MTRSLPKDIEYIGSNDFLRLWSRNTYLCRCDLLSVPGARCTQGSCVSGANGTLALGGWTYQGGRWGADNLLEGRANMSKKDGTTLIGKDGT
jgi:hypothetical protein